MKKIVIRQGLSEKATCNYCGNLAMCNVTVEKRYICWRCVEDKKENIDYNLGYRTK